MERCTLYTDKQIIPNRGSSGVNMGLENRRIYDLLIVPFSHRESILSLEIKPFLGGR